MPIEYVGKNAAPQLINIWLDAFSGDSRESIIDFFDFALNPETCAVWVEDGRPVSMVFTLPAVLKTATGTNALNLRYVYAAATLSPYRGRGLFSRLLEQVHKGLESNGVDACFLHPASPGLFKYYERLGYQTYFYTNETTQSAQDFLHGACNTNECPGLKFDIDGVGAAARRNLILSGHPAWVEWPDKLVNYSVKLAVSTGGAAVTGDGFWALCEPYQNTLFIKEWLCRPELENALKCAVSSMFKFDYLTVRQPVLQAGDTKKEFGMVCLLTKKAERLFAKTKNYAPYMGLAFD